MRIVLFKAIASATVPLGPITVLVGPNDSGKSTILQALAALSRTGSPKRFSAEQLLECLPSVVATNGDTSANIELAAEGLTLLDADEKQYPYGYMTRVGSRSSVFAGEDVRWDGEPMLSGELGRSSVVPEGSLLGYNVWQCDSTELSRFSSSADLGLSAKCMRAFPAIANDLRATQLRLDARAIARPSPLNAPVLPDGSGVVGIVDDLLTSGSDSELIGRVNELIRNLSPHVKSVATRRHPSGGKELHFALRSGAVIPASQMSDGIILATALAAISLGTGGRRLLIEEPENGLHPRQLKVVADMIRSIAQTYGEQIVLTTHSPLLVNYFGAEEVVLVTRDESGVRTQRMSDAKGLDDLGSEMGLGELWYNVGDSNLARPAGPVAS